MMNATIYHHPGWLKGIQRTFGHSAFYLLLENNNKRIEGLFPFIVLRSFITGKKIISLPFSTYCNPLLDDKLVSSAIEIIRNRFPGYYIFEMRTLKYYEDKLANFSVVSRHFTHILNLGDNLDDIFNGFHPTSVRASIRRAEKNHLKITWGDNIDDLKTFYKLEVELRKRLLLPCLPFSFFKNIWEELSKDNLISLPLVTTDNKVIAGGFILNFKDTFYFEYTAAEKKAFNLHPNHKLFSEVIKIAFLEGATKVDFGRSSEENTTLIRFKEKWDASRYPLFHYRSPKNYRFKIRRFNIIKIFKAS